MSARSTSSVRDGSTRRAASSRTATAPLENRLSRSSTARSAAWLTVGSAPCAHGLEPRAHAVRRAVVDQPGQCGDRLEPHFLGRCPSSGSSRVICDGSPSLPIARTTVGSERSSPLSSIPAARAGPRGCRSRPARPRRVRAPTSRCRASPRSGSRRRARPWSGSGSRSPRGAFPRPGRGSARARPRSRAGRRSWRARRRRGCAPTSRRP